MDALNEISETPNKTFFNHVFSTTDESQAEIMNVIQYASMAIAPVVGLNKMIHRFIPEADAEKASWELLVEVLIQVGVMFVGVILIHRMITYFPTYSGFKYENLTITNVVIAFMVIVLSIQTKLGLKVNILVDRLIELINGPAEPMENPKDQVRVKKVDRHAPSQADNLDNSNMQNGSFPPAPASGAQGGNNYDHMMPSQGPVQENMYDMGMMAGPSAANSLLGGSFGAAF
jgi:hypothetical protein